MKHYVHLNGSNDVGEASKRAQMSNQSASNARDARNHVEDDQKTRSAWEGIFINSPIVIMTILFFLSSGMEGVFSWPMYNDLMSQMTGKSNSALSLLAVLFIVSWAGYASHLIGKNWSSALRQFEIFNTVASSHGTIPTP